jgi:hypothetical protein
MNSYAWNWLVVMKTVSLESRYPSVPASIVFSYFHCCIPLLAYKGILSGHFLVHYSAAFLAILWSFWSFILQAIGVSWTQF